MLKAWPKGALATFSQRRFEESELLPQEVLRPRLKLPWGRRSKYTGDHESPSTDTKLVAPFR